MLFLIFLLLGFDPDLVNDLLKHLSTLHFLISDFLLDSSIGLAMLDKSPIVGQTTSSFLHPFLCPVFLF